MYDFRAVGVGRQPVAVSDISISFSKSKEQLNERRAGLSRSGWGFRFFFDKDENKEIVPPSLDVTQLEWVGF